MRRNGSNFHERRPLLDRAHLIGWQFTGYDKETVGTQELKKNLITGTKALNVGTGSNGMLNFENMSAAYIKADSENNILYRVTPVYEADNLVAEGVIMEAKSVDDDGASICYCVFVYNVQPGVAINYLTGESKLADELDEPWQKKDLASCDIKLSQTKYSYTGNPKEPKVTVSNNGVTIDPSHYTISYQDNIKVGIATVAVSATDDEYVGTKVASFTINPHATSLTKLTPGKKKFTAKWKKYTKETTGYQIRYSLRSNMSGAKKVTISKNKTVKTTIKKLRAKKKYYVQIRTYKVSGGKKYYSNWSKSKTVRTK